MDISLTGKRALVGGASKGIGRATAIELAKSGATVTCMARTRVALEEVLNELDTSSGQAHSILVVDSNKPSLLAAEIKESAQSGPFNIVVNNTGGPPDGPAFSATIEEFQSAFAQHVICSQLILQVVLPGMRTSGYGRIINVISTSVKQPIPGLGVSNTIRGAMASWAKTLAGELGPDGITVNNVLPGFTETDRLSQIIEASSDRTGKSHEDTQAVMRTSVPLRRFGLPSETAAAIAFLASPAAAYINGINLPVDGGRTGSL
jgi:3-oxoacyl-[acyl-carrier protein] reductase